MSFLRKALTEIFDNMFVLAPLAYATDERFTARQPQLIHWCQRRSAQYLHNY